MHHSLSSLMRRLLVAAIVVAIPAIAHAQSHAPGAVDRAVRREPQALPAEPAFPPNERAAESRRITRTNDRAASPAGTTTVTKRPADSLWTTTVPFLLILGAVFAAAVFWRKRGGLTPGLPREALEVLGRRPLDPRQSLWLVRIGSRILVLGSSPAGMHAVSEITDPVEVDLLAGHCRKPVAEDGANAPFRSLLSGYPAARPRDPQRSATREPTHDV